MAAVLGKGAANIEPTTPNVYVANRNAPQQLVISGESSAVLQESNRLASQGFKVVQLKVGDAFHTPFMKDAETAFSTKVRSVGLRQPTAGVTVYSNVTGKPYPNDNTRAVNLLATQMTSSVQFVKQVENMYNDGARVFVEFGPRKTLTKLVGQILEGKPDVVTIAVNPGKPGDNSDLLMREAAAQMAVAGVTLDQFDPWGTPNPFRKKSQVKKKRKTSLRLSAATYVSKRTKKMQQKIIDEPYTLKIANGRVSSQPSEADKAKLRQKDTELRNLRNELADAKREIENMKLSLQKAERAVEKASRSQQVQSNGPSNVDVSKELARLNRHRDALASILNDYDASTSRLTAAMTGRSIPSYGVSRETAPVQQQSFSAPVS